jgi:hypothetical protein
VAIALDQVVGTASTSLTGQTSLVITPSNAAASGSRVFVAAGCFNTSGVVASSVSGGSLTHVRDSADTSTATAHGARGALFSADAPSGLGTGVGNNLTITWPSGVDAAIAIAFSFTGLATGASGYLSGTPPLATVAAGGTTWTSPALTTLDADALALAILFLDGVTSDVVTATSPATEITTFPNATSTEGTSGNYKILAATGAAAMSGTFSVAPGEQSYHTVAYKAGAATSAPGVLRRFPLSL